MADDFAPVVGGYLEPRFHWGQMATWESVRRFVVMLAGTQGGKTVFGPYWLYREIQLRGPGDYMVVTPTFPLLEMKALPEFLRLFDGLLKLGRYTASPTRTFEFSPQGARRTFGDRYEADKLTQVFFGYAADPDSLEAATAGAAWLDEAGQKKFKLGSWEAVLRRLSIHQGRALLTTTPYYLGWLKALVDQALRGERQDTEVVRFDSIANPQFPREEFERARRDLPGWKFRMFYQAQFERPAGLIYDSFQEHHKVPRFAIPDSWPRFLGLDFGGVNTAGVFYAREPQTSRLYGYREYKAGGRTAREHVRALLAGEPMIPTCVGGAKSEGQWRAEFKAAGLGVREPGVHGPDSVEVGIDRVYGAHKRDEIYVFDDLVGYLDEKGSYSREVDEAGLPTEKIEDKDTYHFMDAERYIVGWLNRTGSGKLKTAKVEWYARPEQPVPALQTGRSEAEIAAMLRSADRHG